MIGTPIGRKPGIPRRARPSGLPWILPALIVSAVLIYYCIGYTGYISTLNWDGVSDEQDFVGLRNYAELVGDAVFWKALGHTAVFFAATTAAQIVLGLVFAALLHSRLQWTVLYKVLVFVPVVIAPATMAPVFRQIYAPQGQFNSMLEALGLGGLAQSWLAQPETALAVIISIQIWQSTGIAFILYFAAMSQIDGEVLEAARIDGAGNLRILLSIIWPAVRSTTVTLATLSAIASLKTFDIPYLVSGGGPNYGTEFLGTLIYRVSVPQSEVGYGAAISVVLLILAVGVAIVFNTAGREKGARNV
ncbi:carbohydrate ABC transporter permease [Arthrobacter sp. MA-N2]|uniref:carbohydrate ABC transporter permease n=1 Tax=Arthrobacter sp. MA-N2 TaxID=1101188 RepID=UPI000486B5AD|nr:sugar ABC transporter permease [Arthrobacter sp. MA-N2]